MELPQLAYIILAHKNPVQVARLIKRLDAANSIIFVHVDKRVPLAPFLSAFQSFNNDRVIMVKREACRWGDFGIVKATLNSISEVINYPAEFDFVSLLSGQDYPIKNLEQINNFFSDNKGKNFIEFHSMPVPGMKYGGMHRLDRYHFHVGNFKTAYPHLEPRNTSKKVLDLFYSRFFPRKRIHPEYVKPYQGGQWWSLNFPTIKYIYDFVRDHPDFYNFHKFSLVPDEMFFHSILLGTKNILIENTTVNDNLRYIDWHRPFPPYPAIFKREDLNVLIKTDKLFARKFDEEMDKTILDLIDKEVFTPRSSI